MNRPKTQRYALVIQQPGVSRKIRSYRKVRENFKDIKGICACIGLRTEAETARWRVTSKALREQILHLSKVFKGESGGLAAAGGAFEVTFGGAVDGGARTL